MLNEGQLIREYISRAKACGLTVDCPSFGKLNSKIAIIGEAINDKESVNRMPLSGNNAKLLWDTLREYDIRRSDCFVTTVVKRVVTLSKFADGKAVVKKTEIEHWEGLLEWELDQLLNVEYVLCIGDLALHALIGETGITKWRGSVFDCTIGRLKRKVKVIAIANPSVVINNSLMEPMFKMDVHKLRRVMDGQFEKHNIYARINPTSQEAMDYIDKLEADGIPIAFDIEVIANETACIGFANNAHEGMCISLRNSTDNIYTEEEELKLRMRIQELFDNPDNKFIAQNASFDSGWLWYKDRIRVPSVWFDTLLAHHTLYPRLPHNLGYLTAQYTNHPYYKDDGKTWREGGNIDQFWEYNVTDCCITWAVHDKVLKELKQQRLEGFYFSHVQRLQSHLVAMQVGGVLADTTLKDSIAEGLRDDLQRMLTDIQEETKVIVDDPDFILNPKSPKQLQRLFFSYLQLTGRGNSTDATNRHRMKMNPNTKPEHVALIEKIDEYLTEYKFYGTYATMKVDEDNRIRCEYKQYGVQSAPGRLSSAKTLWGSGMNLQNQPQRAYPMFIADPGYMLSYFDLKQAEAKIVAHLWKVEELIANFKRAENSDGFDIHRLNASTIFQVPYEEIPEKDRDDNGTPTRRFLGKRCVHGLNYTMQPPKLAEVCKIPLHQAIEAFNSYHRAFPEIQKAWQDTIKEVRETRQLTSPFGRRMIWLERLDDHSFDSVVAFKPQSTIGDKVSSIVYLCHDDPDWPSNARMLLNIHDALIAIHRPEDREVVQQVMKRHAEAPIMIHGEPVIIYTDFKESVADEKGIHRWSTLKGI